MKNKFIYLCILLVIIVVASCERDDICPESTPTTPLLVIQFFDSQNTTEAKETTIQVGEIDNEIAYASFISDTLITIPLKTNETTTRYNFIINPDIEEDEDGEEIEDDGLEPNSDFVTFNYSTEEVFLNRACGFVINYSNLDANFIDGDAGDATWIDDIQINSTTIEDETTTHVSIYY